MRKIEKFIKKLKDWQTNFEVKNYEFEKYDCEIANLYKSAKQNHYNLEYSQECLEVWKNVFAKEFFELHHPIHNHIKTRAVANFLHPNFHINYIFFIDETEKNIWLSLQLHGIADCFVTNEGVYIAPVPVINHWRNATLGRIQQVLPLIDDISKIYYKDIPFALVFDNVRPFHTFADDVDWFLRLQLDCMDKKISNSRAFFVCKNSSTKSFCDKKYVFLAPRLHWNPNLSQPTQTHIFKESFSHLNTLVTDEDKLDRFDKINIDAQDLQNLIPTFYKEIANDKIS